MLVALGQINTTVGDLRGNIAKMAEYAGRASARGAAIIVFHELSITGYPPRDLVERPSFLNRSEEALQDLARCTAHLPIALIAGYVGRSAAETGNRAANCAAFVQNGCVMFRQTKALLPNYDVFDEQRYFVSAESQQTFPFQGNQLAIAICEDAWNDEQFWKHRLYPRDPVDELIRKGGDFLINVNASPYFMGKRKLRQDMVAAQARRHNVPVIWVNQVGGNDQIVFDGSSFAMNASGEIIASAASFAEDLIYVDTSAKPQHSRSTHNNECEAVYEALVLGTRDYVRKCGFSKALIGLSGGIDSSLVACIAVDALGRENVTGISMPGPYSSEHSVTDAFALARKLGIACESAPITGAYDRMVRDLPDFSGVTLENLQSRLRGVTMMAYSNQTGALVLTTGNKSEIAVGYCTLYGDMCGGLAVISDVPKTLVYALSRLRESVIPHSVFEKPPSAELRPDQKDSDSLPDYDTLDSILREYVENCRTVREISDTLNVPLALVQEIAAKVDRNEYKRQQAAPGLKVTSKAFGIGRRFPIAQKYSE
ncbi:MAG: synthetase [Bryobacterales bacterium]|nr:synthetase [Bryobacterales bacterium]